jgi:hypothetical protein
VVLVSEKWIAAAGALPILFGFLWALVRWHKNQAFDVRAASIIVGSWLVSFLVMCFLMFPWFARGRVSFFQDLGWSLLLVLLFFPIQAFALVFGTLAACMWSLIGPRWVFNILTTLAVLSLIWSVIIAIEGIQI